MRRTKQLDFFKKDKPLKIKDPNNRVCSVCKELQPLEDFPWSDIQRKWRRRECRSCERDIGRIQARLKRKALPPDENHKCPICLVGKENSVGKETIWNLDHCHDTHKFRDYLCAGCNKGLGFFQEDPNNIKRALEYFAKHQKENA